MLAVAPLYLRSARFYKCVGTSTRRTKLSLNRKRCVTAVLRLFIFTSHFQPLFFSPVTGPYEAALHLRPAHMQLLFIFSTSPAAALHLLPFICLLGIMTSSNAAALHFLHFILLPGRYDRPVRSCSSLPCCSSSMLF